MGGISDKAKQITNKMTWVYHWFVFVCLKSGIPVYPKQNQEITMDSWL